MSTPPLLLGAALLFWGLQTGLWPAALALGGALEGSRLVRRRWDLQPSHFENLADLSALGFAAAVVYAYATREAAAAVMALFAWLPFVLFPLAVAQVYSGRPVVDLAAFFLSMRRRPQAERARVDLLGPYLLVLVVSAGAANLRTPAYFAGVCLLGLVALWGVRPRGPLPAWALRAAAAVLLGAAGHAGLYRLQGLLLTEGARLLVDAAPPPGEARRSRTAVGQVGAIQRSAAIALRVEVPDGGPPPALLRDAAYDEYRDGEWRAKDSDFSPVPPGTSEGSWRLSGEPRAARRVLVRAAFARGRGLVAAPPGTAAIERLPAAEVGLSRFGTLRVLEGPGRAVYRAVYGAPEADAPRPSDLAVPAAESALMARTAARLGLAGMSPAQGAARLKRFFQEEFRYTTYLEAAGRAPLEGFLERTRSGHCEYFATATVLLLRAAGVPARYTVGWSVQEFSPLERRWLVRGRHAHAWAAAYIDGAWRPVDTTPSGWAELENAGNPVWQPLADAASWLREALTADPADDGPSPRRRVLLALLGAGGLWLAWRLGRGWKAAARKDGSSPAAPAAVPSGGDSEFYAVERALAGAGRGREACQPMAEWLRGLGERPDAGELRRLLALHNRYRFDPRGLPGTEREALREGAARWLAGRGAP
ncbi:MAG: transglutaminase domain-containing protein [Elusimicrobia bacterium]|nr:transglutaminase domain-containing protein [Elusimicrobiota bacterium]